MRSLLLLSFVVNVTIKEKLRRSTAALEGGVGGSVVKAVVVVPILGSGNTWKVAEPSDPPAMVRERVVTLEIQSDGADGYHLVMSPEGCFTADTWHESVATAKAIAAKVFGMPSDGWAEKLPRTSGT